ncbi:HNH endonuclease [Natranaerofaba carboxydovora]|uniref:HNH endonuclease n=1 Tax=Natranaerofaba carboxydovora TaxID=2742683 RepID=UPI001F135BC0|nr:HNH endonuclease [Natranaerofaba carboxydovora]UMZ73736.1 HNH endonuclease [Natranaerofaba carboxydovora]
MGVAPIKFYVGVTDYNWFNYLSKKQPNEVNFWRPGGKQGFKALNEGDLFLFKLHSPYNYIVGGGFFVRFSFLPVSLAWEAFGDKNGMPDYYSLLERILSYRRTNRQADPDPVIGCIILASPFFFNENNWIEVPEDWSPNIVQGKTYDTSSVIGEKLYKKIQEVLDLNIQENYIYETNNLDNRYGTEQIVTPRLGQGAFRVIVTEAYKRRCAVTGEKALPVLEASHIKPYSKNGPHRPNNGLLLRSDLHTLFDRGYITVNEDLKIEVSRKLKDLYGNGRNYYAYHGKNLKTLPEKQQEKPSEKFLRWHNENVYLA